MEQKDSKRKSPRDLNTIVGDIEKFVYSPGYLHALLLISCNDLFIPLDKYYDINWWDKISYQEVTYLFGLLIKKKIDIQIYPTPEQLAEYTDKTYALLRELHDHYTLAGFDSMITATIKQKDAGEDLTKPPSFNSPEGIIEPVFYGGTGAYDFQYWESAQNRYSDDSKWINDHCHFSIKDAVLTSQIAKEHSERKLRSLQKPNSPEDLFQQILGIFTIESKEIEVRVPTAELVLEKFSVEPGDVNNNFRVPSDSNELNIRPLIKIEGKYLLPVSFYFSKSIDESPFYWMAGDPAYKDISLTNRGSYTEKRAEEVLIKVFGKDRVFRNVKVQRKKGQGVTEKGKDFTEIDILALVGNKAIVVQAKSKKMSQLSKQGNLTNLIEDFQKAIQQAYDQGIKSRDHILSEDAEILDSSGRPVIPEDTLNDVYILIVTTDDYPFLTLQISNLLNREESQPFPLAVNIFDLDLLATYLPDPFDFSYYIKQRVFLAEKIMSPSEISCLGYHLEQKLFIDPRDDRTHISIAEDFGQIIDDDMMRRLYGTPEDASKSKLNQKWKNKSFSILVDQIKQSHNPGLTDAVFFLNSLSSDTADELIKVMESTKKKSLQDGRAHNFSMPMDTGGGISYVAEFDKNRDLRKSILTYSVARKYLTKADEWLGLGSYADSDNVIDSVVYSCTPWQYNQKTEEISKNLLIQGQIISRKVGRNDKCYCGSGRKYKKCCYNKDHSQT